MGVKSGRGQPRKLDKKESEEMERGAMQDGKDALVGSQTCEDIGNNRHANEQI